MKEGRGSRLKLAWAEGYKFAALAGEILRFSYDLAYMTGRGFIPKETFDSFKEKTGLRNFFWRLYYNKTAFQSPREALLYARGQVVFIHGWDGNGEIWEALPLMVCQAEPRLISLVPDVNGFGRSQFSEFLPDIDKCSPKGCIAAVELWLRLMGLRRNRPTIFVGHSMGGASLFYKPATGWKRGEYALCALAPALLHRDAIRKGFYQSLGIGIWAGAVMELVDKMQELIAPLFIQELIQDASKTVKKIHLREFSRTPNGTLAQTFFALGAAPEVPRRTRWDAFRVILGHKDRLVGLEPMLEYLEELGFNSKLIKVTLGDHYFFSVGRKTPPNHRLNRAMVLETILELYEWCRENFRR
ncbi:MAG: hypothetical protein DRI61_07265 [Chloroflexi bacterium]|nr:MAG: hypothetical protein DRI61_07265 [Chloroflexota bacterium]